MDTQAAVENCALHALPAWSFANSLLGNAADAEDAVSEAYVVAAQNPHKVPTDDSWPWFCAVIANVARNMRRKRRPSVPQDMPEPLAANPSPVQAAEQAELAYQLKAELARLEDSDREALCAVFVAGLSQAQAAAALALPVGTVATRVRRAQQQLRERLERDDEESRGAFALLPFGLPAGGVEAARRRWCDNALNQGRSLKKGSTMYRIAILAGVLVLAFVLWNVFNHDVRNTGGHASDTDQTGSVGNSNEPRLRTSANEAALPADGAKTDGKAPEVPTPKETPDPRDSRVLRMNLWGDPTTLDPHMCHDVVSERACSLVYETLLEDDPFLPGALKPLLLDKFPSRGADGTCRLVLRDDIYFAQNTCFTGKRKLVAADVAWSIKRFASIKDGNYWLLQERIAGLDDFARDTQKLSGPELAEALVREVDGLRVVDERTLMLKVRGSWPAFLHALASPSLAIVAREAVAAFGERFSKQPAGSGPYRLADQKPGRELTFTRNPEYRDVRLTGVPAGSSLKPFEGEKLPLCGRVEMRVSEGYDGMYNEVIEGRLDFLMLNRPQADWVVDWDALVAGKEGEAALREGLRGKGVELRIANAPQIGYFSINMNDAAIGTPAGAKGLAIRKALALCIDRAKFCREVLHGRGTPAEQIVPPGMFGHVAGSPMPNQHLDVAAARKQLESAGFTFEIRDGVERAIDPATGQALTLTFVARDKEENDSTRLFAQCASAAGITLKIVAEGFSAYLERHDRGDGQLFDAGWVWDDSSAENGLQLLYSKNAGFTVGYKNEEFDSIYEQLVELDQQSVASRDAKLKLVEKLLGTVDADLPILLVNHARSFMLCGKKLAGAATQFDRQLKYVAK